MNDRAVSMVAVIISAMSFSAAAALWITREHQAPPVINVQPAAVQVQTIPAPNVTVQAQEAKPYVCTPQQAEAGECLPKMDKAVPLPPERPRGMFETSDGRRVTDITVDMTRDKTKKQKKRQRDAKKKLQRDWQRAQSNFPDIFKGWK